MAENEELVESAKAMTPDEVAASMQKELAKVPSDETATAKVTETVEDEEVFVVARNLKEMNIAQAKLTSWADSKIAKMEVELKEAQANLDIAKKRKWATEPFKRLVATATKKKEYYEKAKAALEAGYTIIPNMPMDIFAIRTTRKTPAKKLVSGSTQYGSGPNVPVQGTNSPPVSEGKYVHPRAFEGEHHWEVKGNDGKPVPVVKKWATEWDDDIDFPFRTAKPEVLNATAEALTKKIFDELGAAPARNTMGRLRGDPMVIGSILYKQGYHEKRISFLVSWFIDSKDL